VRSKKIPQVRGICSERADENEQRGERRKENASCLLSAEPPRGAIFTRQHLPARSAHAICVLLLIYTWRLCEEAHLRRAQMRASARTERVRSEPRQHARCEVCFARRKSAWRA